MKKKLFSFSLTVVLVCCWSSAHCWGFWAHQKINYYAVFLLPPEMMVFYKPNIEFIAEHAVDPDKRRYAIADEGPRHFIDLDRYGHYPYDSLPRNWDSAVAKYSKDTLMAHGIVPWHVPLMLSRLTRAFKDKNFSRILKTSTELGHYIADAHVPLHATRNYNGQLTNQKGIHGFWESRVPELLADKRFDFFLGKAQYIKNPSAFIWDRVMESAQMADTVLRVERELSLQFSDDQKYSYEERNGKVIRQYSAAFTNAFNNRLHGMIEQRMRQSIYAIASFWYTAWIDAGQPELGSLAKEKLNATEIKEIESLNEQWKNATKIIGREED